MPGILKVQRNKYHKIEFTSETGTGMAVVSGDRRAPHILAYIDNIKENQDSLYTSPNALLQWSEMYIRNEVPNLMRLKIHCMNLLF